MHYILFETQANFAELLCFALCGATLGAIAAPLKCLKNTKKAAATFALLAICVAASMLNIQKSHIGYQTFLVPITTFLLTHHALK